MANLISHVMVHRSVYWVSGSRDSRDASISYLKTSTYRTMETTKSFYSERALGSPDSTNFVDVSSTTNYYQLLPSLTVPNQSLHEKLKFIAVWRTRTMITIYEMKIYPLKPISQNKSQMPKKLPHKFTLQVPIRIWHPQRSNGISTNGRGGHKTITSPLSAALNTDILNDLLTNNLHIYIEIWRIIDRTWERIKQNTDVNP
jgi:hypothetical protein